MMELIFTQGPRAGERVEVKAGRVSLGRFKCDIDLNQPNVSRQHAYLKRANKRIFIVDNRSGNGTFVNGKRITRVELHAGDEVRIGDHVFHVEVGATSPQADERPTRLDTLSRFFIDDGSEGDRHLEFAGERLTIGRGEKCKLVLDDAEVSRLQATIAFRAGRFDLKDATSVNGTYLNGERITEAPLRSGDRIEMGRTEMEVLIVDGRLYLRLARAAEMAATEVSAAREPKLSAPLSPAPLRSAPPRPRYTLIGSLALALAVALLLLFVGRTHAKSPESAQAEERRSGVRSPGR
jgi:pSer/pThr/pTyr-binding forkhead associated (FHA) protein